MSVASAVAPPIDRALYTTPEGREAALDALGVWFVDALAEAVDDKARAQAILVAAVSTFYDIREAAGQYRGEYAGHFFMADAVGLADTDRPVPWDGLAERVTPEQLEVLAELLEEAVRTAK